MPEQGRSCPKCSWDRMNEHMQLKKYKWKYMDRPGIEPWTQDCFTSQVLYHWTIRPISMALLAQTISCTVLQVLKNFETFEIYIGSHFCLKNQLYECQPWVILKEKGTAICLIKCIGKACTFEQKVKLYINVNKNLFSLIVYG